MTGLIRVPPKLLANDAVLPAHLLALLLALICISYMYEANFLLGNVAMFTQGDAAQHVSGWRFFRDDDWRFPLLHTQRMNTPEGVSIAFTDSIPLMALLLKPFRAWLPESFHYIGLWHAIAYILQSQAAVYLMRALGARSLFAALIGAGFALTWPALLMRFGHTSLLTHALILFALGLYFRMRSGLLQAEVAGRRFLLLLCVAMLIHPYLLAMCYAVYLAFLLDHALLQKSLRPGAVMLAVSVALIGLLAVSLGYLGGSVQSAGFGLYSLNLLAPICGGRLWQCNFDGTGGQGFEGYNYLGAGFLALGAVVAWRTRHQFRQLPFRYPALCAMVVVLTVYALSNRVFIASYLLLDYPLPAVVQKLTNTFRCSGRFFWVVSYLLLFVVLAYLARVPSRRLKALLLLALLLQLYDTNPVRDRVVHDLNVPVAKVLLNWQQFLQSVDSLDVYPVYGCGDAYQDFQLRYQVVAARHHKKINTGYVARATNQCADKHANFDAEFLPHHLYVVPADRTGGIQYLPNGFLISVAKKECVVFEHDMLCLPGQNAESLAQQHSALQPVFTVEPSNQLNLMPLFLPTAVGVRDGNTLVAQPGKAGFLSFGPYRTIAAGQYSITIKFAAGACPLAVVGYWDVVADSVDGEIARGDIRVDKAQSIAEGVFSSSSELRKFEIRTFYAGTCSFQLRGITLTRLD